MSYELRKQLGEFETDEQWDAPIDKFVSDNKGRFKKALEEVFQEVFDEHHDWLESNAPANIQGAAVERAKKLLTAVLEGDEEAASALFECGDSGRYRQIGWDKGTPYACSIHGKLHLTPRQKLREALVEKHAELLKNERILDLESQVEGLRQQIVKANERLEKLGSCGV